MSDPFAEHIASLPALCELLCHSEPLTEGEVLKLNCGGVYLFSELGIALYAGRTRNLRNRYRAHCGLSSKENGAAFAFRLARLVTGNLQPSYKKEGSRKCLMQDEAFAAVFEHSKRRIRKMKLRFVREENDIQQALLEIYVSLHTGAKHNTFSTT